MIVNHRIKDVEFGSLLAKPCSIPANAIFIASSFSKSRQRRDWNPDSIHWHSGHLHAATAIFLKSIFQLIELWDFGLPEGFRKRSGKWEVPLNATGRGRCLTFPPGRFYRWKEKRRKVWKQNGYLLLRALSAHAPFFQRWCGMWVKTKWWILLSSSVIRRLAGSFSTSDRHPLPGDHGFYILPCAVYSSTIVQGACYT